MSVSFIAEVAVNVKEACPVLSVVTVGLLSGLPTAEVSATTVAGMPLPLESASATV